MVDFSVGNAFPEKRYKLELLIWANPVDWKISHGLGWRDLSLKWCAVIFFFFSAKIFPVVKNQHLLLCTLLIGNALAMEVTIWFLRNLKIYRVKNWLILPIVFKLSSLSLSLQTLPIFLDKLVPPWAAILTSVTLILMFGEVVYHQSQMEIVWFVMLSARQNFSSFICVYVHYRYCHKQSVLAMAWKLEQQWPL